MVANPASPEDRKRVLESLDQKPPFLFIDEITELTDSKISGHYTFKKDEFFYQGHFPGNPVTPGVILIEAMAQFSVVALSKYIFLMEGQGTDFTAYFTDCEIEFSAIVLPETKVFVHAEKVFLRRGKLKSSARLVLEDGTVAASGTLAGMKVEDNTK